MFDKRERKIYIKNLLLDICIGWKLLLILACCGAIICGALSYVKNTAKDDRLAYSRSFFTDMQLYNIERAVANYQMLTYYRHYNDKSVLVKQDFLGRERYNLQYFVSSQDLETDYADSLVSIYREYITNGSMAKDIIDELKLDIKQWQLNELIIYNQQAQNNVNFDDSSTVITSNDQTVSFEFILSDGLEAESVRKAISTVLDKKCESLQTISSHKLVKVNESFGVYDDFELTEKLFEHAHELANFEKYYYETTTGLSNDEKEYICQILEKEYDYDEQDLELARKLLGVKEESGRSLDVKSIVLGFLAGLFLGTLIIVIKILSSDKLYVADDMSSVYDLEVLGVVSGDRKKDAISRYFYAKKHKIKNRTKVVDRIATRIADECKIKNSDSVCFYSTCGDSAVISLICEKLKTLGIEAIYTDDLKVIAESKELVITECVGRSNYDDMASAVTLYRKNSIDIIGSVVVA